MESQLKIPKRIKIIITISVLLNAFTLGALTMFLVNKSSDKDHMRRPFQRELAKRKHSAIFKKMREIRKENKHYIKEIRETRNDLLDIIDDDEFDEEEYNEKVHQLASVHQEMFEHMSSEMKSLVKESSPQERKQIAKFLKRHKPPGIAKP